MVTRPTTWNQNQVNLANVPGTNPVDINLPNNTVTSDFSGENVTGGLSNALGNINAYLQQSGGPQYYQGDTLADFTQPTLQAQQQLQAAAGTQNQLADQYAQNALQGAQGGYSYDPTLQGNYNYLNPYQSNVIDQATQSAVGAVNEGFGQGGTLGSARNAAAASNAAFNAAQPYLQAAYDKQFDTNLNIDAANIQSQNAAQQDNLSNIQNWTNNLGTAQGLQTQGANTLGQVGQQFQDQNQALINEQVKAYNYNQQLPLDTLNQQLALGQIGQAAKDQQITSDASSGGSGLDFGNILGSLGNSIVGGDALGGIGDFLGGIFNDGGYVNSPKMKRKY